MTDIRVAVAYHTGYGKTGKLAQAVARGAASVDGTAVDLIDVANLTAADWAALDAAEAIIFGAPTYFGSLSADMKRFFESTVDRWADGPRWKDKLAAGFTNSKTMSGDKLNTLFDLLAFAAQHGMIWVGLDLYPGWHTRDGSAE
ncbi:MAG TPA: flavodoxin family protein, partial [Candidatus Deferrimicrobium sp.]|nr:flavodoxin family protein [Candidatus Deferrimicrobium sp.]